MGIRLNIAKPKLIKTIEVIIDRKDETIPSEAKRKRSINPKNKATKIFANIPAEATATVPHFLFVRLFGLYGTGFAQPNKNEAWVKTKNKGIITEPNKSKCFNGFKVSRPAYSAVLSPKCKATKP